MSLEDRLNTLQHTIVQVLELVKEKEKSGESSVGVSRNEETVDYFSQPCLRPPQAEIRSLELWRSVVAECLGTLCYVFFIYGVSIPWTGHFPPFLSIAFASALAYGALTYSVFPGSHLNPAFTLALASVKCISPLRSILFLTAQSGGAIAGGGLLFGLTSSGYQGTMGQSTIASHVTPLQAFGMEFFLSFVITLPFMANPRNSLPTTALLLAANLVALPCTGAGSGNPARSLGPAFVMNKWGNQWIFWLGPILGALLAAYLHKFILRRTPKKAKKVRETTDGDSLDLPTAVLPSTTHDRLLVERFEPLYGGTRSLYMKPSPVLPRTNLSRSQSVYASKRLEYSNPKFESIRKQITSNTGPHSHHSHSHHHQACSDSNYESLYDRKPCSGNGQAVSGGGTANLLISGPPSYESGYYKTYDTAPLSEKSHNRHGQHKRDPSDSRDNNSHNRILAQYETSKGLVDVDPKAAMKSHNKSSLLYEAEYVKEKMNKSNTIEKKLIDSNESENPPPPPRFRMQMPLHQNQHRYPPPGQCSSEVTNDLSHNHVGAQGKDLNTFPRKPYELLDNPTRKLLDFSPNHSHSHPNSTLTTPNSSANSNPSYSARLLMAEKDSTYSRILEPLMNSKPLPPGTNANFSRGMSPNDQYIMYSLH